MTTVTFLPWLRQGVATAVTTPDTLGPAQPAAATLQASLAVAGVSPTDVTLQLRGPADVAGLDPGEIVRMEPPPGTATFEPNHLAYVDFDRPDLPWLFTPAAATIEGRLRPWLCLLVVRVQDGVSLLGPGDGPLAVLQLGAPARPVDELPDLRDCWAWAHSQVAGRDVAADSVRAALSGPADVALSRLLSPRLLQPDTTYLAALVPVFDVGRRTGLGIDVSESDLNAANALAPAWDVTQAPASVTLPVYASWQFATGPTGDFASLARLLRVQPAPGQLGERPIDVSRPGFVLPPAVTAGTAVMLDGALEPMTAFSDPWTGAAADAFRSALEPILDAAGQAVVTDATAPPLLAPPLYGRWQIGRVQASAAGGTWFDELNLDPRRRVAAALGTRVVQANADSLVAAAWQQAGDLRAANQRLRQLQLSQVASTSLHARTLARLAPGNALRVAAPLFGRIRIPSAAGGGTVTLAARLADTVGPLEATSPGMRRLARDRGPLTRRVLAQGIALSSTSMVKQIFRGAPSTMLRPPGQLMTISSLKARLTLGVSLLGYAETTASAVQAAPAQPDWHTQPEGQPVPINGPPHPMPDSASAAAFRAAAVTHLTAIDPARPSLISRVVVPAEMDDAHTAVLAQLHPAVTVPALAAELVTAGPRSSPPISDSAVMTLRSAPVFAQPMYVPLRELSADLLLPGLKHVEPNRVVGLKTNRRFVESYLLGLNTGLAAELVWRGYPTDQQSTYAAQFWDSRSSDTPQPDITAVSTWGSSALGAHPADPAPTTT